MDCLRKIDSRIFAEHTKHFLNYNWVGPNVWKPYFDGNGSSNVTRALFRAHPETILRTGNYNMVPIMIGTNAEEGALNVVGYLDGRANFEVSFL